MKNYIKTICQMPVIILLYVVVLIEYGLAWCLRRLNNPILCLYPFVGSVLKQIVKKLDCIKDGRSDLQVFMDWLNSQDNNYIETYRRFIEHELGIPDLAKAAEPHLYAVFKTSREENIKRIWHSFGNMNPIDLKHWFAEIRGILQ